MPYFEGSAKPKCWGSLPSQEKLYFRLVELHIFSCKRPVFSGQVRAVYAKSPVGWFGILPEHAPATFLLRETPLRVELPQGEKRFHVVNGVLHVRDDQVLVAAEEVRDA